VQKRKKKEKSKQEKPKNILSKLINQQRLDDLSNRSATGEFLKSIADKTWIILTWKPSRRSFFEIEIRKNI